MGGKIRKVMENRYIPELAQAVSTRQIPVISKIPRVMKTMDFNSQSMMVFVL